MLRLWIIGGLVFTAAAALLWVGLGDGPRSNRYVAIVAGEPIAAEDFRTEYSEYLLQSGLQDDLRLRHSFLDRMVDMRVLAYYGRDSLRLDQDRVIRIERERARKKLLIEGYLHRVVYDTLTISEDDLEDMFVRMNTELSASHLYARSLEEARELKARLDRGEAFADLATEIFADPELAERGGSIGYFRFDEMDPEFENAAFSMRIGEISEPVRTATGFSIIRLDDRRVRPLLTEYEFHTKRDRVRTYVAYRKRLEAREALRDRIVSEASPSFDDEVLDFFVSHGLQTDARTDPSLTSEDLSATAIRLSGRNLTIADVLSEARHMSDRQRGAVVDRESARELLKGVLVRLELLRRAESVGIPSDAEFQASLESVYRKQLYDRVWNHVRASFAVPEDSVRDYYLRHADDFTVPERVRAREIVVGRLEEARSIRRSLTPANFAAAATAYSMRPGADRTGGDLGYVTRSQMGVLADQVFGAASGEMIGPLEVKGRYAIFLVGDRQPARPATLQEARDAIEAQLATDLTRAEVEGRISSVRRHYDIRRFRDRVESIDLSTQAST